MTCVSMLWRVAYNMVHRRALLWCMDIMRFSWWHVAGVIHVPTCVLHTYLRMGYLSCTYGSMINNTCYILYSRYARVFLLILRTPLYCLHTQYGAYL